MDRAFIGLGLFAAAGIAFCVFGGYMAVKQTREFRERCEAAGGVPFQAKRARICLDPSAVRRMPR